MSTTSARLLAIDIGTSAIKLLRLGEDGRVLSLDRAPCDRLDVDAWLEIIRTNIADHGDGAWIARLSITGQMHGLMTLENDGEWGEGIPWHDQRAAEMLPEIRQRVGDRAEVLTGGPLAAGFQATSLAWLRRHDPNRWSRILQVFLPKDALIHALTGRHVVDPSDAVGTGLFSPERKSWAREIVDALRIPRPWLPDIVPSGWVVGRVRNDAAQRLGIPSGTPVVITGGDAAVGAYGAGATAEGDALILLSSGAQLILPTDSWRPDPSGRWYSWPSAAPAAAGFAPLLRVGTLLNAGIAMSWAQATLAEDAITDAPTGLIALPHLIGTREEASKRGAILGITPETSADEIRRAVLEGIAFTLRRKLEEMTQGGAKPSRIRIGGGFAHVDAYRQLFADVLNVPVQPVGQVDLSVYGAALLGAGVEPGESDAGIIHDPDPDTVRTYDMIYPLFLEADDVVAPLMAGLTRLRHAQP